MSTPVDDPTSDIKVSDVVDDGSIEHEVKYHPPLVGIEQTNTEWLIGNGHVGKTKPLGGRSWRSHFDQSTRLYPRKVTIADGRVVVGIVFRHTDKSTQGTPIEHLCGWVPVEREAEALGWIDFLNGEIRRTLAWRPDEKKTE